MSNSHKPHANVWLQVYVTCTASLGVGLLFWSLSTLSPALPDVLLFVALVALAEWTSIEVFSSEIAFSISAPILLAALILFGPLVAALVGIVGGLVTTMVRAVIDRRQSKTRQTHLGQRALFNMAVTGISIAISGWAYLLLGGQTK